MQNIYYEVIEKVQNGAKFQVDFQQRSLKIDGKYIIKNGEYEGELGIEVSDTPLLTIAQLFLRYQHSLPSERSDNKRYRYFNPLPEHELSDNDICYEKDSGPSSVLPDTIGLTDDDKGFYITFASYCDAPSSNDGENIYTETLIDILEYLENYRSTL